MKTVGFGAIKLKNAGIPLVVLYTQEVRNQYIITSTHIKTEKKRAEKEVMRSAS
jgi:hypothetical protein